MLKRYLLAPGPTPYLRKRFAMAMPIITTGLGFCPVLDTAKRAAVAIPDKE